MLENDCRRLLAYHIVSQVGYMVAGVGIGTEMAVNGATSHAFAHILYKALLFMGAGAVIYVTGRRKLTELGGLYAAMPLTVALYMVGPSRSRRSRSSRASSPSRWWWPPPDRITARWWCWL